jgi:6-phosphogluconolactonase
MAYYMYVSLQDDDKILSYAMDPGTGQLTPRADIPAAGGPSASAISPDRSTFYVGLRNSQELCSYRIDPNTGGLTQTSKVSVEASPSYLSTDRNGRFLLSAYYQGAHVAVHQIGDDGSLGDKPIGVVRNRACRPRDSDRPVEQVRVCAPHSPDERQRDPPLVTNSDPT